MVEKQLKLLKPNLAGWEADFGKEMMTKGQVWMNYAWSGDAVWVIDEVSKVGVSLDYEVPKEGSNIWFDGWIIPKYARNVKAASYSLNYFFGPGHGKRHIDPIQYPDSTVVDRCVLLHDFLDKNDQMLEMWSRVKRNNVN